MKKVKYCCSLTNGEIDVDCLVGISQLQYESQKNRGIKCFITGLPLEEAPCIKALMLRNKKQKIW